MNTAQMIEVMQAFENGKKIEFRERGSRTWKPDENPEWDWSGIEYRIAPESAQKKGGRWERVEISEDDGQYCLHPVADIYVIDALPRIPGFGGIDYQSPFDTKVIVRSMVPVMFKSKEGKCYVTAGDYCDDEVMLFDQTDRPGIPVAAWFWREVKK